MRSTYQSAFDSSSQRVFNLADRVDLNAYAKANHSFHSSRRPSNKAALTYDNKLMHYMPGGGGGYPRKYISTGILPSLGPVDKKEKNFIQQNILQSSRSVPNSKRQDKFEPEPEQYDLFQASNQLDNFINQYKRAKNRQSADQILSNRFQGGMQEDRSPQLHTSPILPTHHMHSVSLPHLDQQSQTERHPPPIKRRERPNQHFNNPEQEITTHRNTGRNIYNQTLEGNLDNNLSLDLNDPVLRSEGEGRDSGVTSAGGYSQLSPRRAINRHTMAARDRSGKVVRWIENDTNGSYGSVADYFNEKLKERDLEDYDRQYGGHFEEENEKQISGTFGAEGGPLVNYKEHLKNNLNSQRRFAHQANTNLHQQTHQINIERPQLYRNVTSWRDDSQWGQSTYSSTFDKSGQSQLDEMEQILALPTRKINPKTGLKRVLEVTTNKGVAGKPALYIL